MSVCLEVGDRPGKGLYDLDLVRNWTFLSCFKSPGEMFVNKYDENGKKIFPPAILTWMEFDLHFSSAPTFLLQPRERSRGRVLFYPRQNVNRISPAKYRLAPSDSDLN